MKIFRKFISLILTAAFVFLNNQPALAENIKPLINLSYIFDYGSEQTVEGFLTSDEKGSYIINLPYYGNVKLNAVCEEGFFANITYSQAKNLISKSGNTTASMIATVTVSDGNNNEYLYTVTFNFENVYATLTGADDAENMTVNNASWIEKDGYMDIETENENEYAVLKHCQTDSLRFINYGAKVEKLEANSAYIYEAKINMYTINTVNSNSNLTVYPFLFSGINAAYMKYWYKDDTSNTYCMNNSGKPQISASRDTWHDIKTVIYTDENGKVTNQESFFNEESAEMTKYQAPVNADRVLAFAVQNKSYVEDKTPVLAIDDVYFYKTVFANVSKILINDEEAVYNRESDAYEIKTSAGNLNLNLETNISLKSLEISSDGGANYSALDKENILVTVNEGETKKFVFRLTTNSDVVSYCDLIIKTTDNDVSVMPAKNGAKSIVSMTFDDGDYETAVFLDEMFEKYSLKGTCAVIAKNMMYSGGANEYKWGTLVQKGRIDFASHSFSHMILPDTSYSGYETYKENLTEENFEKEIMYSKKYLEKTYDTDVLMYCAPDTTLAKDAVEYIKNNNIYYAIRGAGTSGGRKINPSGDDWYYLHQMSFGDLKDQLDSIIENNNWVVTIEHGIKTDGQKASAEQIFLSLSQKQQQSDVWVASANEAIKYIYEKQNCVVSAVNSNEDIVVSLDFNDECTLDKNVFNYPLTVKVKIPSDWSEAYVMQNGVCKKADILTDENYNYVYANIIPSDGKAIVCKSEENESPLKYLSCSADDCENAVNGFTTSDLGGSYTVTVPYNTKKVSIKAVASSGYMVSVNNADLTAGETSAYVKVTAPNGKEYIYTLKIKTQKALAHLIDAQDGEYFNYGTSAVMGKGMWDVSSDENYVRYPGKDVFVFTYTGASCQIRTAPSNTYEKSTVLDENAEYVFKTSIKIFPATNLPYTRMVMLTGGSILLFNTDANQTDNTKVNMQVGITNRQNFKISTGGWHDIKVVMHTDDTAKIIKETYFLDDEKIAEITENSPVPFDSFIAYNSATNSEIANGSELYIIDDIELYKLKNIQTIKKIYSDINVSANNANIIASVNGGDDESWQDTYSSSFEIGDVINLKASASESGYSFLFWKDLNNNAVVSYDEAYSFTVGTSKNLAAVYIKDDANYVTFKNPNNIIVAQGESGNIYVPQNPYIYGYKFDGWYDLNEKADLGAGEIVNVEKNTVFNSRFTKNNNVYTIIADGQTGSYLYNDKVTVTAKDENEDGEFAYWECGGNIVSYDKTYSFLACSDLTLNSVYGVKIQTDNILVMANPVMADETKIAFFAERNINSSNEVIETGILLSDEEVFDITNAKIKAVAKSTANKGQFTIRKGDVNFGETWHAKAYAIYRSVDGSVNIIYSNRVSKTID